MSAPYPYPGLEEILSPERFSTYLRSADNDRARAIALYRWNVQLSESFYPSMHMLEVALRNRIHAVIAGVAGPYWYFDRVPWLTAVQSDMIEAARTRLQKEGKASEPGDIVAALTFGFWTAMLGRDQENLWQTTLHKVARRENGKGLRRKDLAVPLNQIRLLRNRIAHHEPIFGLDLNIHHRQIEQVLRWVAPPAAEWCRAASRFPSVWSDKPEPASA